MTVWHLLAVLKERIGEPNRRPVRSHAQKRTL